jgi:CHAT domain-containing protein/Tfp pilus assembly protein PilF
MNSMRAPHTSRHILAFVGLAGLLFFSCPAWSVTVQEVQTLESQYNELYAARKYREAVPVAEQLVEGVRKLLGPKHATYTAVRQTLAHAYNNAGIAYQGDGAFADAEKYYKRALELREQVYPPNHPETAQSCDNLGTIDFLLGRYQDALAMHSRALAIRQKIANLDPVSLSDSFHNLGGDYWMLARYGDAEQSFDKALGIRQDRLGPADPKIANTLSSLGLVYQVTGRFSEAGKVLSRSLAMREQLLGPDHPDVANSLNNLGHGYWLEGRYAEAEAAHLRALAIREKAFGPNHASVAESLHNLGNVYFYLSRHADAESRLRRALAIEENTNPNQRSVALILQSLAGVYEDLGSQQDAEALRLRGLAILEKLFGRDHPEIATNLTALAANYIAQKRFSDAQPLLTRALAIREKTLGADNPDTAWTLSTLGDFYMKQGRFAEAEPVLARALAVREKSLGPRRLETAITLQSLGEVYRERGQLDRAEPILQQALATRQETWGKNNRDVAETHVSLAKLKFARGAVTPALEDAREATSGLIGRAQLFATGRVGHRDGAGAELKPYFVEHVFLAYKAAAADPASNEALASESFLVAQSAQNTAAANALSQMAVRFAAGKGPLADLVRQRQDLGTRWHAADQFLLEALSATGTTRSDATIKAVREELASIEQQIADADARLAKEFPDYSALANPKPLSVAETQALLAPDEVLIAYLIGEKTSYVFAVKREGVAWKELKIGADELTKTISAIRSGLDIAAIQERKASPVKVEALYELYQIILQPVDDFIRDKPKLIVVPDGALTSLPFQVLVTEPPKPRNYREAAWLLRRHMITVSPSVASLKVLRQMAGYVPGEKPLTGFGDPLLEQKQPKQPGGGARGAQTSPADTPAVRSFSSYFRGSRPDFDALRSGLLPPLPGTAVELKAVAEALGVPKSDIKLGADATERAVKTTHLTDYRIVYFATHGLVSGEVNGLAEPALVFTIPERPSEQDDGLLTASEVAGLRLNADWVVLSACNTAAGDRPGADGLSGLARAFFYAGARALLVSHWQLDDESTARITTDVFTRLSKNPSLSRAQALQEAMLALIDHPSDPQESFPAFWAPFVVVGDGAR